MNVDPETIPDFHPPLAEELDFVSDDTAPKPYEVKGLQPSEKYRLRLAAHSAGGYGPFSNEEVYETAPSFPTTPGTPMFMTSTSSSITVSWVPPRFENGSKILRYEVGRMLMLASDHKHKKDEDKDKDKDKDDDDDDDDDDEDDAEKKNAANWVRYISPGAQPVFTMTHIPNGSFVKIRVRAKNELGFSPFSTISEPFQALDPVRLLEKTPSSLKIIWQTIPALAVICFELQIRVYGLMLSEDMYNKISDKIPQNINGITQMVSGLKPGTEYQFRSRGNLEEGGWQSWSDGLVSTVFKTVETEPDPPTAPYDKMGASTATGIVLKWEAGSSNGKALLEFELHWRKNEREWEMYKLIKGVPTLPVGNLESGSNYQFKVRARNEIGWSEFSELSRGIRTNPIPIPGICISVKYGIGWVQLQWEPPPGHCIVTAYELQSKRSDMDSWVCQNKTNVKNGYLVQDMRPCAHYCFRVRAQTFDGWSSFSEVSEMFTTVRRH